MPTSAEEQKDLDALKISIDKAKISAFDLAAEYIRMDEAMLRMCGQKTKELAVLSAIQYGQASIKRVTDAFLKKWPD